MGSVRDPEWIPVSKPDISELERRYVAECLGEGWISSDGPWVEKFEAACAERFQRRFAVSVTNGSAALDAAVVALGLSIGDEVIVPAFTIISCAAAVIRAGATPVFVDADPETWCIDVSRIEDAITARTKAIMAVHIYGLPCDMDPIISLAEAYGLALIEDAAEAHGQVYKERPCGSFGEVSTLSFYANKHVTTGEGGMVLTNDIGIAQRLRDLRNLFFRRSPRFVHEELGWNLRMGSLQAALGLAQLERLDSTVEKKRQVGLDYLQLLSSLPGIRFQAREAHGSPNHYWVVGITLDRELGITGNELVKELELSGIGSRPFFYSMTKQPVIHREKVPVRVSCPVAEYLGDFGCYLPSYCAFPREAIRRVFEVLERVVGGSGGRVSER